MSRTQFRPGNAAFAAARPLGASRFYATEPESKTEEAATEGKEKANSAKAEAEDPAKKELEAKNKEIIDLKVCRHHQRKAFAS